MLTAFSSGCGSSRKFRISTPSFLQSARGSQVTHFPSVFLPSLPYFGSRRAPSHARSGHPPTRGLAQPRRLSPCALFLPPPPRIASPLLLHEADAIRQDHRFPGWEHDQIPTEAGPALPPQPWGSPSHPHLAQAEEPLARPGAGRGEPLSLLFPYYSGFPSTKQSCQRMQKFSASFPSFKPSSPSFPTSSSSCYNQSRLCRLQPPSGIPPLPQPTPKQRDPSAPSPALTSRACPGSC